MRRLGGASAHAGRLQDGLRVGQPDLVVRPETREKRLNQMLDELAASHGYMNMRWEPGKD